MFWCFLIMHLPFISKLLLLRERNSSLKFWDVDEFSIQNNLSLFSFSSKQLKFLGQNKIKKYLNSKIANNKNSVKDNNY